MAGRNTKQGLDYFSLDVDFFDDEKIEFVSARFGIKGEIIAIRLLCKIYRIGYFTEWNEDESTLLAKRAGEGITPTLVSDVVNELVRRGFFDETILNSFGILTSSGIQKRYAAATTERKEIEIRNDIWLVDAPKNARFSIYRPINSISPPINSINRPENEQSKVKYSKENKPPISPLAGGERVAFVKPTCQDVDDYCRERGNGIAGAEFFDFYESKGWFVGKNKMKDWRAAVRTWENKRKTEPGTSRCETQTTYKPPF